MFLSLSLLRGKEAVSKCQAMQYEKAGNHARSAIISSTMLVQELYLTNYDAESDK